MITTLRNLQGDDLKRFWKAYLPLLSRSIKVEEGSTTPREFVTSRGFGEELPYSLSWRSRENNWYRTTKVLYDVDVGSFIDLSPNVRHDNHRNIPIFTNYADRALASVEQTQTQTQTQDNPEMKAAMKDTMNTLVDTNKSAIEMAAKLSVGKTANTFFVNKLIGKLPWFAKLFGKKKELASNTVTKMVAAQTALTLVTHFAPDNKKLTYIAEGMVQEAVVDMSVNSDMLSDMITELESLVHIPDLSAK